MFLTKQEVDHIEAALKMLPHGEDFMNLSEDEQDIVVKAESALVNWYRRKKDVKKMVKTLLEDSEMLLIFE